MAATAERWTTELLGRPTCLCGERMKLARIAPHLSIPHAELRTYECAECGHTLVKAFGDDR
jgi:hypothetical protein